MVIHQSRLSGTEIRGALSATSGNVKAAAARLSVPRNVLYRRMAHHDIDPKSYRNAYGGIGSPPRARADGAPGHEEPAAEEGPQLPARTQVLGSGTHVFGGTRGTRVFARAEATGSGAVVCDVVHVPHSRAASGKRDSDSSSFGPVDEAGVDGNGRGEMVSRSLSLPRAVIALLLQQRRVLSAALDRDISLGAMLALFVQECLVPWVDQQATAAREPVRATSRNGGKTRR